MTINPNHGSALVTVDPRPMLWENWMALRNGNLSLVAEIIAPDLTVHLSAVGDPGGRLRGRAALVAWVSALHAAHPAARLTVEVGPVIGPDLIAGRWHLTGIRRGVDWGRPLQKMATGVDIIRIAGDRIVEYWGHDDDLRRERPLRRVAA
ncbi:ester cyclase [Plantactinospora sp. CA-290183]|uniref:ester cyclase n=1 Tax=Plantactinospora sp. CA-290183 TaxID=3240006 RepID=UPI003D8AF179